MDNFVKVAVRMRPLLSSEKEEKAAVHWKVEAPSFIYPVAYPSNAFRFSHVFTEKDDNEIIYSSFCSPIVQSVVKGFNGAIIAYGQISSGKTFTMMGDDDIKIEGIIHFSIYDLFKLIENEFDNAYLIRIACFEVYRGKIRDLLCDSNEYLPIEGKIGRIKCPLLTWYTVQEPQDIFNFIKEAQNRRETRCTLENKHGSGSSLIIDLLIESFPALPTDAGNESKLSHLCFVDLAENIEDFQPNETRSFSDTGQIKMMRLKKIINHFENNKGTSQFIMHQEIPRLKIYDDILSGNFETQVICTVSPTNLHETYAYLEIASLARRMETRPKLTSINLKNAQVDRLNQQLEQWHREMKAAEKWNHHQCRDIDIKLFRLIRFWRSHFLCLCQFKNFHSEKMGRSLNELRWRKSLPQQPVMYTFCSLATPNEPKKRR